MTEADHLFYFLLVVLPFLLIVFSFSTAYAGNISELSSGVFPVVQYQIYESVLLRDCLIDENHGFGSIDLNKFNEEDFKDCIPLKSRFEGGLIVEYSYFNSSGDLQTGYVETENVMVLLTGDQLFFEYPVFINGSIGVLKITYLYI